jgi:hypothetical protein
MFSTSMKHAPCNLKTLKLNLEIIKTPVYLNLVQDDNDV